MMPRPSTFRLKSRFPAAKNLLARALTVLKEQVPAHVLS
jgi:hypothetical protein